MTDNEIIKALEEMVEYPHYYEEGQILKNVLDLINRQKAEIDDLERIVGMMDNRKYYRKFVDEVYRKEVGNELSDPDFDYIYQLYFDQKAEIERLKALAENGASAIDTNNRLVQKFTEIKSEAIKEFAERLKNKIKTECNPYGKPTFDYDTSIAIMHYIDNLVKEMVGEDNAE